jgi:hypothetical protein
VVWVGRQRHDPHIVVIARFSLIAGKLYPKLRTPRLGHTITMVGPLVRTSDGLREVDIVALR